MVAAVVEVELQYFLKSMDDVHKMFPMLKIAANLISFQLISCFGEKKMAM